MHAFLANSGARIAGRHAKDGVSITAAGSGDATQVVCDYVDRTGFTSMKVIISYTAVLAATKTLSIASNLASSLLGGADAGVAFGPALAATVVATGPGGGGTVAGVVELDFDLSGADQFVRNLFTPDLSATATDTASLSAVYVLSGGISDPVTGTLV
ncbi:MAG: hypothetical protein JWO51_154 [Rhodospirillales bacterium]|nr:hypothetical protein [Rhodospirillales bacterium]